ncbi:uncharacterized protein K452DRAFT_322836 [Aplosporella prunicola CBS 121167]|uniref:Uncharacterized protein n=1 Tax=Aplosporella prunicola CBS 121167 TaxID=1176127 RepID=A0A6A6AXW3_9PEZI|nr:uncharacterized protein K452DRAFT_322836 [Aplosporella prunicola CBS 121167]KAF2135815.1 hypothetical protein K452DRAFT_322836 [Aplosporella prunicola CBS 121167]
MSVTNNSTPMPALISELEEWKEKCRQLERENEQLRQKNEAEATAREQEQVINVAQAIEIVDLKDELKQAKSQMVAYEAWQTRYHDLQLQHNVVMSRLNEIVETHRRNITEASKKTIANLTKDVAHWKGMYERAQKVLSRLIHRDILTDARLDTLKWLYKELSTNPRSMYFATTLAAQFAEDPRKFLDTCSTAAFLADDTNLIRYVRNTRAALHNIRPGYRLSIQGQDPDNWLVEGKWPWSYVNPEDAGKVEELRGLVSDPRFIPMRSHRIVHLHRLLLRRNSDVV